MSAPDLMDLLVKIERLTVLLEANIERSREDREQNDTYRDWVRAELAAIHRKVDGNHAEFQSAQAKALGALAAIGATMGVVGAWMGDIIKSYFSGG